jgi:lipoate-protein ligase B
MPYLYVVDLGAREYEECLELQRDVARRRISGEIDEDVLLLVEHPAVITLGRSARQSHLIAAPALLAARGVETFEVERGGDVTYHGPGQLVGYPIIDLKRHRQDLHWYLRHIEAVLIQVAGTFGIDAGRSPGFTGVWVGDRKLASIGVHARDWVTWHGFALNVTTDLSYFDLIVPCGIPDVHMTSIAAERGHDVPMSDVKREVVTAFSQLFGLSPDALTSEALRERQHRSRSTPAGLGS